MRTVRDIYTQHINEAKQLILLLEKDSQFRELVATAGELIVSTLSNGKKILVAGNGGSAGEAQHFSGEIAGRYKKERKALPAITLTADTSIITAIGNDYSFDSIFERQVEALGVSGDLLVVLSTSGNSENILLACKMARNKGMNTIGFLGKAGGRVKNEVDIPIIVPSNETARVQEAHLTLIHVFSDLIDEHFD